MDMEPRVRPREHPKGLVLIEHDVVPDVREHGQRGPCLDVEHFIGRLRDLRALLRGELVS